MHGRQCPAGAHFQLAAERQSHPNASECIATTFGCGALDLEVVMEVRAHPRPPLEAKQLRNLIVGMGCYLHVNVQGV